MGTTIILTRHGESTFNATRKIQGQSFESILTRNGIKESEELGISIKKQYNIDYIYSSDLPRTKETAKIISKVLDIPYMTIVFDRRAREIKRGLWEGSLSYSSKEWVEFENNLRHGIDYLPTGIGIESYASAMTRCNSLYNYLIKQHENDTILLIGHGEINKVFLSISQNHDIKELLTIDRYKYRQPNCCINEIIIKDGLAYIKKIDYIDYRKEI